MTAWQYRTIELNEARCNVERTLSDLGAQGWELVTCTIERINGALNYACILRRPA